MEEWASLNEDERPFGLAVGDSTSWNGLVVERVESLGPNWHYVVRATARTYAVNIFNPSEREHRMVIQGKRPTNRPRVYIREDLEARSAEDALVQALTRVLSLADGEPKASPAVRSHTGR